jgi:hypothetical protein
VTRARWNMYRFTFSAIFLLMTAVHCKAQEPRITKLAVTKKDGKVDGKAVATVLGPTKVKGKVLVQEKTGSIASHVLQAWPIMNGHGALLLLSPAKAGEQNRLRYYQTEEGKSRSLGLVGFSDATLVESTEPSPWAFALTGVDPSTKQPMIVAGDVLAIHSRLLNASEPQFSGEFFSFHSQAENKKIATATLMGWQVSAKIYSVSGKYLQFFPNGTSITTTAQGVEHGQWTTDGNAFYIARKSGPDEVWKAQDLEPVAGIPAETHLTVRLLQPLSSRTAKVGTKVDAVLLSPGVHDNTVLLPQGAEFHGTITDAHGVGLGIKHETAALTVHFDSVTFSDGRTMSIDARILKVENSREDVTPEGKIQGIRSTGTIGHTAENQINSLAQIDPIAYIFTSVSGPAVLGFAEPEILYNAGTELDIAFNKPVITNQKYTSRVAQMALPGGQDGQLNAVVKALPFRTETETGHVPSDVTNLIFIGSPEALQRAFTAAGWTSANSLTAASTFQTAKALTGNQTYTEAPMSVLTLDGQRPINTLQKTTNTFSSRHHLRIFPTKQSFEGQPVLTSSSTQDIGIAFSAKQKTFIHVIDQYLDNERSKVVNDLEFTGCVQSVEVVPRPWVPQDAYNSTGDRLRTDGNVAILRLNDCATPHATPTTLAERAPLIERSERNTALTIKDTLYRGNLIYTGISGGIKVHHYFATRGELSEDLGNWRQSDASNTQYRMTSTGGHEPSERIDMRGKLSPESQRELDVATRSLIENHKWDPPHFEIGLNVGYSSYRIRLIEDSDVTFVPDDPTQSTQFLGMADGVNDGWAAGVSLTLNSWNWVSNEFSYMRQQTKYNYASVVTADDPENPLTLDTRVVGLVARRFAYNTIFNLRPRKSRWRPYISAGPAFQMLSLSDAPLKKPAGIFKLGLGNIGLLKASFDFGGAAPLDGGGIFQFALQYGAGIKYRVTPRFTVRGDYGETWSATPKIIRDSYLDYEPVGYHPANVKTTSYGPYIQQRATVGFAFTF